MFEEEGVHFLPVLGSNDDGEVLVPRAGGTVQSAFRNTPCLAQDLSPSEWLKATRAHQSHSTGQEGFSPHLPSIRCHAAVGQCRYQSSASQSPVEGDVALLHNS